MGLLGMLKGSVAGGGSVNVGTAVAYLELNTEKFAAGLDSAVSKLNGSGSSLSNSLNKIGSSMTDIGSTLTKTVTVPVVGLGTAAVKTFADFEQGMAEVKAIAGEVASSKDFDRIVKIGKDMGLSWEEGSNMTETAMNIVKAKAEEMGATTEWTSTQAAEAFKYMAMAGWDVGDMLEGITPIMNLATASGEDLGTTSDIVTDALTAFGLQAKDTAHFTDILAKAASSSNTTVSKMGESFKFVAPVMGSLGMSAEDTAVALGLMANNGIKSGMAGRALKNVLTNLSTGAGDAGKAMAELDISLEKNDGSVKSLKELFDELRQKFRTGSGDVNKYTQEISKLDAMYAEGKINEEEYANAVEALAVQLYGVEGAEKAKLAAMLAGKQGMAGLLAIINASEEDYNKLTDAIANCDGATDAMAATMRDTTYGSLKLMTSAIDALLRSFGEILAPVIRKVAEYVKELAEKFNALDDSTKETIVKFAAIAAIVGPVLTIFGSLARSISSIITLFSTLKSGISAISGIISGVGSTFASAFAGIGMIIGGAITAIVNFVDMWKNGWSVIKTILEALGLAIAAIGAVILGAPAAVAAAIAGIIFVISQLAIAIHDHWDQIKAWCDETITSIREKFEHLKEWWSNLWETILGGIENFFSNIRGAINRFFYENFGSDGVLSGIPTIIQYGLDAIVGFVQGAIALVHDWIVDMFNILADLFTGNFEKLKEDLKELVSDIESDLFDIGSDIRDFLIVIWNTIKEFLSNIWDALSELVSNIMTKIKELKDKVVEIIHDMFENIKNKVHDGFEWIKEKLHDFLQNAREKIHEFIEHIIEKVMVFKDKVVQTLQELFDNAKQKFHEMIELIREKISEIVQTVREKITEIVETVREKIREIVETVKEWLGNLIETIKEKLQQIWDAITEGLSNIITAIKEKCEEIWERVKEFAEKLKEGASQLFEIIIEKIKSFGSKFWEAGKALFTKLWDGIKEVWNQLKAWVDEHFGWLIEKISNVVGKARDALGSIGDFINGSHATGLSYVPFNGYVAQLHEGERVLTKQENREYSQGKSGGNGDTYNIYSYEKLDEYNIRRELMKMKRQLEL